MHPSPRSPLPLLALLFLVLGGSGCDDNQLLTPDPALEPLVGKWDAVELVFTPPGDGAPVDALAAGATFVLDVQPSGLYTAILTLEGGAITEIGRMEVGATEIVMEADYPAPGMSSGTYELEGGRLTIRGQTETSLLPGTTSVVDVLMVFERQEG